VSPSAEVDRRLDDLLAACPPASCDEAAFLGARFDAGLAWVWFPEGHGGFGAPPELQEHVESRLAEAGAPLLGRNPIALGLVAPTLVVHGTDEQRRHLRAMFTNEEIWCQLFSEPAAGSDVANLRLRAEPDGESWVLDGQKVWSSMAHEARFGLVIARTDPAAPKHAGMTAFLVDMATPGVVVAPLRQMTGEAEFNEVFFDGAVIPDSQRLGGVGEGWRVVTTTLMNERMSIGGFAPPRGGGPIIEPLLRVWRQRERTAVERDRFCRLWIEAEVNRLSSMRVRQLRDAGTPGPGGSLLKLGMAENAKRVFDLCVDLLGPAGMLYPGYEMTRPERVGIATDDDPRRLFVRSRAMTIEGGTSEVMKNIVAERMLGLPGEPRSDKGIPWRDIPVSTHDLEGARP
jgi:alkylation response protein AidB-like acyl-CoA dehydrogenase